MTLLTQSVLLSSTFTYVGLPRAEEVLLCMAPSSRSALPDPDRASAIRMSLAAAAHSCDQASRGQRTPLGRSAKRIVSSRLTGQRNDGVSPVFSRQALMLLPQAPGSQRLVLHSASTYRCKAPVCIRVFLVGSNLPTHLDSPSRGSRRRHSREHISIAIEACFP